MEPHLGKVTLLVLAAAALTAAAAATAEGPRMVVGETIRDFGQVDQGFALNLDYRVENRGDATLVIDVRSTCGCTVVEFDREIPPRAIGSIRARIDTAGFAGPVTKTLLVTSNDPTKPRLDLSARAIVSRAIEVLPRPLVRLSASRGEGAASAIKIVSARADGDAFQITAVEVGSPWIDAVVRRLSDSELVSDRGPSQFEIGLLLSDQTPPGPIDIPVTVLTDHPLAAAIPVKIVGVVKLGQQ